jgi:hypothetical protein
MVMPVALAIGCGDEVREGGSADGSASINLSVGSTSDEGSSTLATDSSWDNDTDGSAATLHTASAEGGKGHCGESEFVFDPVPPNVVLVLDKSGSMMTTWNAGGMTVTRWYSLHGVVQALVESLDASVYFGVKLFPDANAGTTWETGCGVIQGMEVPVAPMNAAAVLGGIPPANATVQGGTPATAAMQQAVAHLHDLDPAQPRAIVLITDGAANCVAPFHTNYDPQLNATIDTAYQVDGIPTYVVGIGVPPGFIDAGVNLYDQLNDAAVKGGRPKDHPTERFYSALDGAALNEALSEIGSQLTSCVVVLDPKPDHPDLIEVEIDGQPIPQVDDCEQGSGWAFLDDDKDRIILCGQACDALGEGASVNTYYKCPPPG